MKSIVITFLLFLVIEYSIKSQNFSYIENLIISEAKRPNSNIYFKSIYRDTLSFYRQPSLRAILNIRIKNQKYFKNSCTMDANLIYSYNGNTFNQFCSALVVKVIDDNHILCEIEFERAFTVLKENVKDENYVPIIINVLPSLKIVFTYDYIDENDQYHSNTIESLYIQDVDIKWSNYR